MKRICSLWKKYFNLFLEFFSYVGDQEKKMGKTFDWQMSELEKKGIPAVILEKLKKKKRSVVFYACHQVYYPNYFEMIDFFPVIPFSVLKEKFDFPLFSINQEDGCLMNICESIDTDKIYNNSGPETNEPYFVFGAESGLNENSISGVSPRSALRIFEKVQIKPMNLTEALSFLMLYGNLYNGNGEKISVLDSRYRKDSFVPEFSRSRKGFKLLDDLLDSNDRKKVYPAILQRHFYS
ncbi:MAG TPA: hypothetical protein PK686_00455 [bacterium]|nr:hypothetical protein [bacterium]HPV65139.1 hypothetical protein [bacterium]